MQLFYQPHWSIEQKSIQFDQEETSHIIKVLRKKKGDFLLITNGKGYSAKAQIHLICHKKCTANIVLIDKHKKPWNYILHLAVAPTKQNSRYEWFLEKATEIGVDEITPIICDNSERKVIKKERFFKIIKSAMKQSLKFYIPKLNDSKEIKYFLSEQHSGEKYIATCSDLNKRYLKQVLGTPTKITLLIGPEGDFSSSEIDIAIAKNFKVISLGASRLRTETAAIVACHSVAYHFQS